MRDKTVLDAVRAALRALPADVPIVAVQLVPVRGAKITLEFDPSAPPPGPEPFEPDARHSPDYRSCTWYGVVYSFTPTQARCVRVLWEALRRGEPELSQADVLRQADSCTQRFRELWREWRTRGMHPAWRAMIVSPRRGVYRLRVPAEGGENTA